MTTPGIRPYLRLLQTPAQPPKPNAPVSFDRSRPAPQTDALRAAWWSGHEHGFKDGWVGGVRWGIVCGLCTAACLAALAAGISVGLRGWWW